jgi:putative copper resistance protein D
MIDTLVILARFLHYAATTALFGVSLFPLYAYVASAPELLGRWRTGLLLVTAVAAVLSGLFWFVFSAENMAGSLSDLADIEILWAVVRDTGFGVVWTARMFLVVVIVSVIAAHPFHKARSSWNLVLAILAAVFLASLAGTGHAQVEEGGASIVHMLSDAAHLLAAGAWLGGLVPLAYSLACHAKTGRDAGPMNQILLRFSGMGYVAVATLLGSGFVNSWFLVGSVSNLIGTPYGQVLLVKLMLFAGMVALAAANRLWLVPLMSSFSNTLDATVYLHRLRNHVFGEQALGVMVLLIVSILGTMRPAIGQ